MDQPSRPAAAVGVDQSSRPAAAVGVERARRRRPTIREVARLAGVSHQTVSRYLRLDSTVNEAIQQRIGQAIAQLDYRPNLVARAMRNRRTGRLALLLPPGTAISSLEVLAGATAVAHEAGYAVEVVTLDGPAATRADRVRELADSGFFEAIVSFTPLPADATRTDTGTPVVVSPHYDENMRGIGELADASAIEELIVGLADRGHRRFLHLAGDYAHTSARCRRDVFLATIDRLGLEPAGVADCGWRTDPARQAVLDLPADRPATAVIAANDILAVAAMSGAVRRGWSVPGDLSVTGWDDNPVAAAMTPALTTVRVDHDLLGRHAVTTLLATLTGTAAPERGRPVTTVKWRESTGPAPAR
ncbi:LacI family DNA-binding transcriptional regulator [Paractinoplanes rishiriensis]|uniref:LacI family DNA-binding transcriptional regulator n=1 Tax=Paractinoplanes rishiriensis TaxID=1050105 RepID=UPI0019454364|nr:LacI family DNA-binding transcriptional regulator [Actinoplanes rishiriensis]